jgi:hypothetical protein
LVGSEKYPIKAHKVFLVSSSDVFKSMFCGDLQEKNNVVVEDIEQDVFLEMLRYIYAKVVNIDHNNVFKIMYAASKYIIIPLEKLCGNFIQAHTTESNALEFFEAAHLFDVPDVEKACLKFVLQNPIHYFEDPKFMELSKTALEKIIKQPNINCTSLDLEMVTLKWLKNQDPSTPDNFGEINLASIGLKMNDFRNKVFFNARVNDFNFETFKVHTMSYPGKNCTLYGFGIYTGVRIEPGDENIAIKISNQHNHHVSIQKTITTTSTVSIQNIMFPMLPCYANPLEIVIEFETSKERSIISVPDTRNVSYGKNNLLFSLKFHCLHTH